MNPSRRQLLRGDLSGNQVPIRPPWAVREADFLTRCSRCGDCIRACPEGVIRLGSGGFPEMDFRARGCSFCGDCIGACAPRALRGNPEEDRPWRSHVDVTDACFAMRGIVCRSCGDACEEEAIRFQLYIGGRAQPQVEEDRCTGCGACVGVCPTRAVRIRPSIHPSSRPEKGSWSHSS